MTKVKPRLIALDISGVDRSDDISDVKITSAPSADEFLSFKAARDGGDRDYALVMTLAQDPAPASLYSLIWDNVGNDVTGVYAPFGNEVPSISQPHYEFTATVMEPDGDFLGGTATRSRNAVATIEVTWPIEERPVKVTAP